MDAKGRDESKNRQREETLARRIGEALDQMNPRGASECPDAEIIAAYADRGLAPNETARWESHFATCARCRKVLRVLAATSDSPLADSEVAHLGELVAAARVPANRAPETSKMAPPRTWDWRMRWLAPALGVAAVLAVWFAIRPPWKTTEPGTSPTLVAQAPKELAPPTSGPMDQLSSRLAVENKQALKSGSSNLNGESRALDSRNKIAAGGPAAQRDELKRAIPSQADDSALQKKAQFGRPVNEREATLQASPAAPQPPSPAPPPANVGMVAGATAAPQSDAKSASDFAKTAKAETLTGEVTNAPPAPPPKPQQVAGAGVGGGAEVQPEVSPRPATNAQSRQAFGALKAKVPTSPLLVRSLVSDAVLWRAGAGGTIERSTDSGRSWTSQASPAQEDWLSGAAVSDTVCWLAGRNGAIARTLDGQHWDRVSPPPQAAGNAGNLPDWTGIAARDAQSATVTAGDARRFATSDGGKTWQAQQ